MVAKSNVEEREMRVSVRATIVSGLLSIPGTFVYAQQVCEILAKGIQQDVLIQGSDFQRFDAARSAICNTTNSSYTNASKKSFDGSLSVPDYVDIAVGTHSDNNTWSTNFAQFCSATFSLSAMSSNAIMQLRTSSATAYNTVAACVQLYTEANGIFGLLSPAPNHDSVNIKVTKKSTGQGGFKINGIVYSPISAGVKCGGGLEAATPARPIEIRENQVNISCTKPRNVAITLSVNTTEGALGPYQLSSENDELGDMRARIASLEGRQIPERTIAYFNQRSCPTGWLEIDAAKGRYIVALTPGGSLGATQGQKLTDLENRATGAHSHSSAAVTPKDVISVRLDPGALLGRNDFTISTVQVDGGAVPGTNAPYVQFMACEKRN